MIWSEMGLKSSNSALQRSFSPDRLPGRNPFVILIAVFLCNAGLADEGAPTANAIGNGIASNFETKSDPYESAFTLELPDEGWCTLAGMTRAQGLPRAIIRALDHGRNYWLFIGDGSMPIYLKPDNQLEYVPADHSLVKVRVLSTADSYAREYLQNRWGAQGGLHILSVEPDMTMHTIMESWAKLYLGSDYELDTVRTRFALKSQWGELRGELNTTVVSTQDLWGVEISGFTTRKEPAKARELLVRIVRSFTPNADWVAWENRPQDDSNAITDAMDDQYRYTISPAQFLMGPQTHSWDYYWEDKITGEIISREVYGNPDPSRYEPWLEEINCMGVLWDR